MTEESLTLIEKIYEINMKINKCFEEMLLNTLDYAEIKPQIEDAIMLSKGLVERFDPDYFASKMI